VTYREKIVDGNEKVEAYNLNGMKNWFAREEYKVVKVINIVIPLMKLKKMMKLKNLILLNLYEKIMLNGRLILMIIF
jgi:hypothetical protein